MSKILWITAGILFLGFGAMLVINQVSKSKETIIGVQYASQGEEHIKVGQAHSAYNSDPASSGPHYSDSSSSPAQWGVYTQEVAEEVFIHNEEHGGVIVTYQPDLLPKEQLKKLQALFAPPYSNAAFLPKKAIVTPRAKNTSVIQLAAWTYTLNLDKYDEATIIKFFRQHSGKAPEALAGPNNTPINQAASE